MFIIIIVSFLGYVLPWGQMSLWGATVIINLLTVFPIGDYLVKWIWGGFFVSNFTLKLIFTLHFILPILLLLVITVHIMLLHFNGSSNSLGSYINLIKIEFLPVFLWKDLLNLSIVLIMLILTLINPYLIRDRENFNLANPIVSPAHIQPEWYFLQYYAILRAIPRKLGGVLFFVLSLAMLTLLFLLKYKVRLTFKVWYIIFLIFIRINLVLIWLGGSPVEFPFLYISQIFSILYFSWFFLLIFFLYI